MPSRKDQSTLSLSLLLLYRFLLPVILRRWEEQVVERVCQTGSLLPDLEEGSYPLDLGVDVKQYK